MRSKLFWIATGERAVKSFAQALILMWAVSDNGMFNIFKVELDEAMGSALGMAVLSVLTSLLSAGVGNEGPSMANETVTPS